MIALYTTRITCIALYYIEAENCQPWPHPVDEEGAVGVGAEPAVQAGQPALLPSCPHVQPELSGHTCTVSLRQWAGPV